MSLETFAPVPHVVTLNDGREVALLPLRLGQMPAVTKAAKPMGGLLLVADFLTILDDHAEAAADLIRAATPLDGGAVAALYQDEVVRLLTAIQEVNQSFFIQRLRPEMTQAALSATTRMKTLAALAGVSSLPGSGSTATTLPPA